jgi:hypothetical protein
MPAANIIIDIFQIELSFGRVISEIHVNLRRSEIAHWYNTSGSSYNVSYGRLEFTAVMISFVGFLFISLFIFSFI